MASFTNLLDDLDGPTAALLAILGLSALYWYILPRPLPGIPYNRRAAWTPLGDIPSILGSVPDPGFSTWLLHQPLRHRSPLVQLFFMPFQRRPALILADHRAARELLTRRAADFDNSAYVARMVSGIVPNHHVTLPTGLAWRARRRLVQDLMSQRFLRDVVAPGVHGKAAALLGLWERKCELAGGRCFDMRRDVSQSAMDAVLGFSFGGDFASGTAATSKYLDGLDEDEIERIRSTSGGKDEPVVFPIVEPPEEITATVEIVGGMEKIMGTLSPPTMWWILERTSLRKALAVKKRYMTEQLEKSVSRLRCDDDESWVRSALDHIVARERMAAEKEGRQPNYLAPEITVEAFFFVVAGYESTSTTEQWMLKFMADNPQVQQRLRTALREAWPAALAEQRIPTVNEIHGTVIPFLDATVEESLRCAGTLPNTVRDAIRDTTLLGHFVPKGTTVFLTLYGPGILVPPFPETIADDTEKVADWDPEDMHVFKPERWLVPSSTAPGGLEFSVNAGPSMPFSLGLRSCFGKRMAYYQLRTVLALVVWRFVLEKCPEELSTSQAVDGVTHRPKHSYVKLSTAY